MPRAMLSGAGVFIPRLQGGEANALQFWGPVFGWGSREGGRFLAVAAATVEEKGARGRQVIWLVSHLQVKEGALLFEGEFYQANRPLCYRFFSALQGVLRANGAKWKVVILAGGVKGFTW